MPSSMIFSSHSCGHKCVTKSIMGQRDLWPKFKVGALYLKHGLGWLKLKWYGLHRWCCNLTWQHMHYRGISKPILYMTYVNHVLWTLLWMHRRWMILSTLSPHNTFERWRTVMMTSYGKWGVVIVMALGKNVNAPWIAKWIVPFWGTLCVHN
jgi:hypothetical protein